MKNKMAKPLGVTPATRGRAASIRICIPDDLRAAYGGRADFRISLGKGDWASQKSRATFLRAEKENEFAAKREAIRATTTLIPVPVVSPELSKAIALGVYTAGLTQDDDLRESTEGVAALRELAALAVPSGLQIPMQAAERPPVELDGLTEAEAQVLADLNAMADGTAAMDSARRRLTAVLPAADAAARALGLEVDWSTVSARSALKVSLEEHRRAWRDRTRRDAGEAISTPAPVDTASLSESNDRRTLADAFKAWKAANLPGRTLVSKTESGMALVDECLGKSTLRAYTKSQGAKVVAHFLAKSNAQKTALDKFNAVKALLNFAAMQDWIPANPWTAHSVKVKKSRKRVDIPSPLLIKLFDSALFKSYELPASVLAGGAAAYWVPLLGLYTGARQSDLCQLRIEDIADHPEMGLSVTIMADAGDEEEDSPATSAKNETGRRRVPIHSELIRLGFADYVEDMKDAGSLLLFPDVKYPEGQPAGTNFTKWFSAYRKGQGVAGRYQDFHAFRHTSRTRLTDAEVDGVISDALLGHTVGQSTGRKVYDHSIKTLRKNLEKLEYPELKLDRCYPKHGDA